MKATVIVTLKPTVLDPQGMTIQRSVESMGLGDVSEIRQGKYFDINLKGSAPDDRTRQTVERLAKEVLTNPVIEQYRIVPLWDTSYGVAYESASDIGTTPFWKCAAVGDIDGMKLLLERGADPNLT